MNNLLIPVWKPIGWTPLKSVGEFRKNNPKFSSEKVSYAGRLDPMAEGILLLLVGDENKNKIKYENLNKTYESEIVLGISTDSFDGLGLITKINSVKVSKEEITKSLNEFLGRQKQIYPPYSSKAVNGKSLYWWARNKKLNEIKIPEREIEIFSIELIDFIKINLSDLASQIIKKINIVEGDFRQDEIIENWEKFNKESNKYFIKIKIKISCSSGTYVRRIASDLGKKLKCGAFAFSIKRNAVGDFYEEDVVKLSL